MKKKWYRKVSNWLFIIICIVLVPILIFNISIMIQAQSNKDEVPSVFGYKPFIVLSGSMESKIHKGDLIITKIVDPKSLKEEDIIAFRDDENTVTTHRIIDIVEKDGEKLFVTKGDNNNSQDQNLVEFKDVEGKFVTRLPSLGSIMNSLADPTTIVILVLAITVVFSAGFMISVKKQKTEEEKEFLEYKRLKELEQIKDEEKTPKRRSRTNK